MASSEAASQPGTDWDEAQCKASLAELERVQERLDDLRLTIHRIVQPLSTPKISNSLLFTAFKQAMIGSQNNIKDFRAQWQSQEIQSILDHTKESLNANSDLSAGAELPRYGWTHDEVAEKENAPRMKHRIKKGGEHPSSIGKEEIARILEDFQKANPQLKVVTKGDNRDLMIEFVIASLKLKFHIVIEQEANGRDKLNAECLGTAKPFTTINRCVASRPRANDLNYLLAMIAAYKTVKASACAKCSKLLDSTAQVPTARRSKEIPGDDDASETVWEAFHESCLD